MAAPGAGIDAHEDMLICEELRPARKRIAVVDGDTHARLEGPGVLGAGCEVWRKENAAALNRGEELQHALQLAARYALKLDTFRVQRLQHLRVRIGLHGIKHARDRGQRAQRPRRGADAVAIVDVGRIARAERA